MAAEDAWGSHRDMLHDKDRNELYALAIKTQSSASRISRLPTVSSSDTARMPTTVASLLSILAQGQASSRVSPGEQVRASQRLRCCPS
eukprot:scaffold30361_cov67-Isochrysis_galbana.AAC.1